MVRSPLIALLGTFAFFALVIVAATALFVALVDSDVEAGDGCTDPETGEEREISNTAQLAESFDSSLQEAQAAVASGQATATVTFSESQVSSRAASYLEETALQDVVVCFHDGSAEARATYQIPAVYDVPVIGDDLFTVYATAEGSISFAGERPSIDITEIDAGRLPGFITDQVADLVEDEVNNEIDGLQLDYAYEVTFTEGEAALTLRPR
ncbi:MAG: hypothetical protein ABIP58_04845 [Dehalococcoidia bacterium]